MEERKTLYRVLDIITAIAGCVYIGAKFGEKLIERRIKRAKRIEK